MTSEGEDGNALSVAMSHPDLAIMLIEAGVPVQTLGKGMGEPLMKAIEAGNLTLMRAIIEAGVDVIMTTANQVGIGSIQASQEAGVKAIGFVADQHAIAPGTVVGSVLFKTPKFFTAIVKDYLSGKLTPQVKTYGWKEKFFVLGKWDPGTPEKVKAAVRRHIADLGAGKYKNPYKKGKGTL